MQNNLENSISTKELYSEYNWYENVFSSTVQEVSDDFFTDKFSINLVGISKNINCLLDNEPCFVTKIKIDDRYDMFFRLTEDAIGLILDEILGKIKTKFDINKISDIEAKIITSFSNELYRSLKDKISEPDPRELKRINFDLIHLTYIVKAIEGTNAGKIIVTLPLALLNPEKVQQTGEKFNEIDFPETITDVKIFIGKTKFSLYDLKNLEKEDVVVFEQSNIENLKLSAFGTEMDVRINPNMSILIPKEDNEGEDSIMADNKNIWDSIDVEIRAEFDSVKISLGELKNIENGLVVDLASMYDNNVTLSVEGKPIASGSLVIVNDRYGVKINNVIASGEGGSPQQNNVAEDVPEEQEEYAQDENSEIEENSYEGENSEEEEDFDYSDFELEDENI